MEAEVQKLQLPADEQCALLQDELYAAEIEIKKLKDEIGYWSQKWAMEHKRIMYHADRGWVDCCAECTTARKILEGT